MKNYTMEWYPNSLFMMFYDEYEFVRYSAYTIACEWFYWQLKLFVTHISENVVDFLLILYLSMWIISLIVVALIN